MDVLDLVGACLEFVSTVISSCAWPVCVLLLAVLLRRPLARLVQPLANLVQAIKSIRWKDFEINYALFEQLYGDAGLGREDNTFQPITEKQKQRFAELVSELAIAPEVVAQRLATYGARSVGELSTESAAVAISRLEQAAAKQRNSSEAVQPKPLPERATGDDNETQTSTGDENNAYH